MNQTNFTLELLCPSEYISFLIGPMFYRLFNHLSKLCSMHVTGISQTCFWIWNTPPPQCFRLGLTLTEFGRKQSTKIISICEPLVSVFHFVLEHLREYLHIRWQHIHLKHSHHLRGAIIFLSRCQSHQTMSNLFLSFKVYQRKAFTNYMLKLKLLTIKMKIDLYWTTVKKPNRDNRSLFSKTRMAHLLK